MKTTVNFRFRESTAIPGRGVLVLFVTRHRKTRSTTTGYKLSISEWDEKKQCIITRNTTSPKRERELRKMQRKLDNDQCLLAKDKERLQQQDDYNASDLIDSFRLHNRCLTLGEYVTDRAEAFRKAGKISTARAYETAYKSFIRSRSGFDIDLCKLDSPTMVRFEQYLKGIPLMPNSISCYMRSLSALYNHALETGIIPGKKVSPFKNVFTGYAKTEKRALPQKELIQIKQLEAPTELKLSHTLFLFSFFTQGMSYIDVVSLTKENIRGNYIVYKRNKTGQTIKVEILPCIRQIIQLYQFKDSPYLFPVLRGTSNAQERWQAVQSGLCRMNRQLKTIARLAGITTKLTSYVARHSWATTASSVGVPIQTISRGMGHESERTTAIYVALLDTTDVDRANRRIMNIFNRKNTANNYVFVK